MKSWNLWAVNPCLCLDWTSISPRLFYTKCFEHVVAYALRSVYLLSARTPDAKVVWKTLYLVLFKGDKGLLPLQWFGVLSFNKLAIFFFRSFQLVLFVFIYVFILSRCSCLSSLLCSFFQMFLLSSVLVFQCSCFQIFLFYSVPVIICS